MPYDLLIRLTVKYRNLPLDAVANGTVTPGMATAWSSSPPAKEDGERDE
jgi:hypothetical protein